MARRITIDDCSVLGNLNMGTLWLQAIIEDDIMPGWPFLPTMIACMLLGMLVLYLFGIEFQVASYAVGVFATVAAVVVSIMTTK